MAWDGLKRFISRKKKEMPAGLAIQCEGCKQLVFRKLVEERQKTCPECNYHFTLTAPERIELCVDPGTFEEMWPLMGPTDPLNFSGAAAYKDKIKEAQGKTGLRDAIVVGKGRVHGHPCVFGVTDSRFLMGSMGSVVGEKIARATEKALELSIPLIIVSGSGGGARMYEGCLSLMQMAKTSAALAWFHEAGGLFISVLTNPTMAGVMASFASLGDVILAEPKALIGFTGPRVIEQTIKQELPKGFQRSEFLLERGFIDRIVERQAMKDELAKIIDYCTAGETVASK